MMKHYQIFPKRNGKFTLVELLIVLAIIMVLLSLLQPALIKVRNMAQQTVCLVNVGQVVAAVTSYTDDNNGLFPPSIHRNITTWLAPVYANLNSSEEEGGNGRKNMLSTYMGEYVSGDIFQCPLAPNKIAEYDQLWREPEQNKLATHYNVLWNYEGITNDGFEPTRRLGDGGNSLLLQDRLAYSKNDISHLVGLPVSTRFESSHPFHYDGVGGVTFSMESSWFSFHGISVSGSQLVPRNMVNAGFTDGHASPYESESNDMKLYELNYFPGFLEVLVNPLGN